MSSLTGNLISSTYPSLLKVGTNNTVSANLNNITDGVGNNTSLFISTAGAAISGSFTVSGSTILSGSTTIVGTLAATSSNAVSASYAVTSSYAVSSSYTISSSYALSASYALTSSRAISSSYALSSSYAISSSLPLLGIITASANASTITFTKGDQTTFNVVVSQSGSVESASYATFAQNAGTASYAANADLLDGKNSTVFATTGSNILIGTQVVSGSITPGGLAYDLGSIDNPWQELYVSTGSVNFVNNGAIVSTLTTTTAGVTFPNGTIGVGPTEEGFGQYGGAPPALMNTEIGTRGPSTNAGSTFDYENLVFGIDVMNYITAGSALRNIGIGQGAACNITTGDDSIAVGYKSGHYNRTGTGNITIGTEAGLFVGRSQTPLYNTFVGDRSATAMGEGSYNTAFGNRALSGYFATTTSNLFSNNTAIGNQAGYNLSGTSTNNIYIGSNAGPASSTQESYKFYVSNGDANQQPFMFGNMANASRALTVNGDLIVSGSLIPSGSTYSLGTLDKPWKDIYVSENTINFVNNGAVVSTLGVSIDGTQISGSLVVSGSLNNGLGNQATGNYSRAEGYFTVSSGSYSHAEGGGGTAYGESSHTEGAANSAYGDYSHAEGNTNFAYGGASHVEGSNSYTYGDYSHAEGQSTYTYGPGSHAEGASTVAYQTGSHAEGRQTIASGSYSHAEGSGSIASGSYSHAEGVRTRAIGFGSHAEGFASIASGSYSHAEGVGQALGLYSHAEGGGIAYGTASHAEGNGRAYGIQSHAEAGGNAYGTGSHAEGGGVAYGDYSHAEGTGQTYAEYSHAEGFQTVASASYSSVIGIFNLHNNDTSIFVIGDGQYIGPDLIRHDLVRAERGSFQVTGSLSVSSGSIYTPNLDLTPQSQPASPVAGQIYFDTNDSHFYGWNGSTWKQLDN